MVAALDLKERLRELSLFSLVEKCLRNNPRVPPSFDG